MIICTAIPLLLWAKCANTCVSLLAEWLLYSDISCDRHVCEFKSSSCHFPIPFPSPSLLLLWVFFPHQWNLTLSWDITPISLLAPYDSTEELSLRSFTKRKSFIFFLLFFAFCFYLKQCQDSLRKWSLKWDPCFCLLLLTYMSYT